MGEHVPARPRARRHPVALALGLLLVASIAGLAAFAGWSLYSDFASQASARDSAVRVAEAVRTFSISDDSPPAPVDAVSSSPGADQVALTSLPFADDLPADVTRLRITDGGALSVLTSSGDLCSGVTLNMTAVGRAPSGSFFCGEALPPPAPAALTATPRDRSVILQWPHPSAPVEDYAVSYSADGGRTWGSYDDGVTASSRTTVRPLVNGRDYVLRVVAENLAGESAPVTTTASPFTEPDAPTDVRAIGGFRAVVTWTAPADDGGRPVTGYLVSGEPAGACEVAAQQTRCEIDDLPAAPGYTFTVRALNEAGAGAPSSPEAGPVSVYSAPGRAVALSASAGDRLVLLTWTSPLRDGNTPITDYAVQYRPVGDETWTDYPHPASPDTVRTVTGLANGTAYEFQVLAVNAVGTSEPPLTTAVETPATVPAAVPALGLVAGDSFATLTWGPPSDDGASPITDYVVEYRTAGNPWVAFEEPIGPELQRTVTDLVNGTMYGFRVAAVNRMGQGPWSTRTLGTPVGPPGPVLEAEAVGSLTEVSLSWRPPANDGGRPLLGYRVDYRLSSTPDWIRVARLPSKVTTLAIEDVEAGESYDFRILAINEVGVGPSTPDRTDRPTLAGVIADETPPSPTELTAIPGDGIVTLSWQAVPAGKRSPITAYTVTGSPGGTCSTAQLTCVVSGLTNGQSYAFTVSAANEHIVGPESAPVRATPMVFNAAQGGVVSTYTRGGRTYRIHTFTSGGTLTVTAAPQPFTVLVVGGGGGSTAAPGGIVFAGGGGGVINARSLRLPTGTLNIAVGAGGPAGAPGGVSSMDAVGSVPAGAAGSPAQEEFSPTSVSSITGTRLRYGGVGTPTSGQGADGRGVGGGGPTANRGGNGIVVVRYEIAR